MHDIFKFKFMGARVIKTGLAVLITAWICLLLELPAIFAVITAIVSIERTASDSIRKGLIRFPASAIGAAVSISFAYMFGESAMTYAFAATLTIIICNSLKLQEGALVAVLTAVAMVPSIESQYLLTFLSRLGTTSIGLFIATIVNIAILPPKFTGLINTKLDSLFIASSTVLKESIEQILNQEIKYTKSASKTYLKLREGGDDVLKLSRAQRQEWKYHKVKKKDLRKFYDSQKRLNLLERIILHLGNLQYMNQKVEFTPEQKNLIENLLESMVKILQDEKHQIPDNHYLYIDELDIRFKYQSNKQPSNQEQFYHHFTPIVIIFYELLSLHDTLEELEQLVRSE
ncbi:FUSC family protein [Bacillus sp. FJAT-45350]|uniref:FUSC family protein n=1 Tax=Bacillus sp. FJAT-45350 TaxID=2011014 RepID=UPI000BB8B7D5|nr:aromatic acid exporter family protein [Bacillus sp. FJAT-45350]